MIFNSTFIGRAGLKNKGKISRYLANKCAIAARVDCFSEAPTDKFGESLKAQIEERLKFLASGSKPRKNKDAMAEVIGELKKEGLFYGDKVRVKKEAGAEGNAVDSDDETSKKRDKKEKEKESKKDKKSKKDDKKDKKRKREESSDLSELEEVKPKSKKVKA